MPYTVKLIRTTVENEMRGIPNRAEPTHHHLHNLSLILHHHPSPNLTLQVHCHLLTTGLHRHAPLHLWSTLLRRYSLSHRPHHALLLYNHTPSLYPLSSFSLAFLLKACANSSPSPAAHALAVKCGLRNVHVQTAVVNMYFECGSVEEGLRVFDEMPHRNVVTWNVVVTGLVKWGAVDRARAVFERMARPNVVSWTGIIDGYTWVGRHGEAVVLFREMLVAGCRPSEVTVLAVVPAVWSLRALDLAGSLHGYCVKVGLDEADVRVTNSLIDMYAKCGCIERSYCLFEEMSERRNLVSWTSMVSGFAMHGMAGEALALFRRMEEANLRPNAVTFLGLLSACGHGGLLEEGMSFLGMMTDVYGLVPEVKHYGCVVDMLGRAGRLAEAERMVMEMPMEANAVVWRTLLGCCNLHGDVEMGERVMKRILELEKSYGGDYVMMSNVLAGCGRFGEAERVRRNVDGRDVLKVAGWSSVKL